LTEEIPTIQKSLVRALLTLVIGKWHSVRAPGRAGASKHQSFAYISMTCFEMALMTRIGLISSALGW
jgi:hypothetical protein